MDWPLKLGDRVVISDCGKMLYFHGPSNPHDIEGEVSGLGSFSTAVTWDNGWSNVYYKGTLELVYIQLEND
jgi:small-conductance mechanosensitive channel